MRSNVEPPRLGIVVPTYNEVENIQVLLTNIASESRDQDQWLVIVVDDNSTDGTSEAVDAIRNKSNFIHLMRRPSKMGLGSAYKDGFAHAINNLGCEIVMEMDADLSHSPNDIPNFLQAIAHGYQVVIGSRKVPGGHSEDWNLYRRLLSYGANMLARSLLGLQIRDVTSGFRAYTKSALQAIDYKAVKAQGFDFQVETLFRAHRAGLRIAEIPIIFRNRKKARSKLEIRETAKFARTCLRLWNQRFVF